MSRLKELLRLDEPTSEEWDEVRSLLRDRYKFFIINPPDVEAVEYTLFEDKGGEQYPVLSSNTLGRSTLYSRNSDVGDGFRPTEGFINVMGWGPHEAMSAMPHAYLGNDMDSPSFDATIEREYGQQVREYEEWMAFELICWMVFGDEPAIELKPLAMWADVHTEFTVPIMEEFGGGG
jgi:hypothetical protein